jgi:HAD superfamily hydrolase (TIGR01450 family)
MDDLDLLGHGDLKRDGRMLAGVILDVDGVLWVGGEPAPKAHAFLDRMERSGIPYCLLTNDASVSRQTRARSLVEAGLRIDVEQLVTAPFVTAELLKARGWSRVIYLGTEDARNDIAAAADIVTDGSASAVVIGDLFDNYRRLSVEHAVEAIIRGAALIAMQRNRFWHDGSAQRLDNGFWVSAFEFVTGKAAEVAGKPSPAAYKIALERLGLDQEHAAPVVMISDDISSDLAGANVLGLQTLHVSPLAAEAPPSWLTLRARTLDDAWDLLQERM